MSGNSLSEDDKKFLINLINDLKNEKEKIITDDMQAIIDLTTNFYRDDLERDSPPNRKIYNLNNLIYLFNYGLMILNNAINELNSIKTYMENDNDKDNYDDKNITEIENDYEIKYKPLLKDFVRIRNTNNRLIDDLYQFSSKYTESNYPDLIINIELIFNVIVNLLRILPILSNKTNEVQNSSVQPGKHGGFRKKNNLKPTVVQSKEILGKIRRIYKVAGSRKEHIKYKGELISVSDYKKLVSQAKALKSQNKPVAKPATKPKAKSATKAKSTTKSAPKPKAKSAPKPKAK